MPSAIYVLFRNAIMVEQQVTCSYDGQKLELCPHIIGTNRHGEEVVLAWQFGGESNGPLPQWRCLKLSTFVSRRRATVTGSPAARIIPRKPASTNIDLDINVQVRKRR